MAKSSYIVDLTEGPIFVKLLKYSLPVIAATLLQLAFNAADTIIVGRFGSPEAMAAVGSTGSIIHLQVCLLLGLAIGSNVVAANLFGAKNIPRLNKLMHTAMATAIVGGILFAVILVPCARTLLSWTDTPQDVLDKSTIYMQIYMSSLPFICVYNFGSAILRAVGDTKRPLYYLAIGGVVNVLLNMFFVICLHHDADGVAIATAMSQVIASVLVWIALARSTEIGGLSFRKLGFNLKLLGQILYIGIPSALQSSCFGFSNIMLQKAINGFGAMAMAGSAASGSLEGLTYSASHSFFQVAVSYSGQNLGAKKFDRIRKGCLMCMLMVSGIMLAIGGIAMFFGPQLMSIYTKDPEVVEWGLQRFYIIQITYFLCGMMDVLSGNLRGIGHTILAFVLTFFFVCIFRVIWIFTVFKVIHNLTGLMTCYPVSWILATVTMLVFFFVVVRKAEKTA